uniref:Uncharacterized protein n=1 Tax=Arundo donax TaxID=35708 RepID=A0A0A9CB77_ARUDO
MKNFSGICIEPEYFPKLTAFSAKFGVQTHIFKPSEVHLMSDSYDKINVKFLNECTCLFIQLT